MPTSLLLHELMSSIHDDGHEGIQHTLHQLHWDFHMPNHRNVVQDLIGSCSVGLLMPFLVPQVVWANIGMDFIEALP